MEGARARVSCGRSCMKNTFGQSVTVTLFGESHGAQIGAVLDGMAPGLFVDEDFIRHQLSLRRPRGKISTPRVEADAFSIVSGVFEGRTTGTPICILIPNTNTRSGDYERGLPRPRVRRAPLPCLPRESRSRYGFGK